MKMSRRAIRMEKRHASARRAPPFNMISLMDIFTILVFFLLVNSGDVQVLPNAKTIALPESAADRKPRETIVVMITDRDILVQGKKVATVSGAIGRDSQVIPALKGALVDEAQKALRKRAPGDKDRGEITIMGDKEIPYRLLKKVMATCTEADYGRISLAVLSKVPTES